jgi:hypothetical protein
MKDSPKDVDTYLSSAEARPVHKPTYSPPEPRVQKNFRVRKSIADELMREAMEESIRTGVRVTQESIVEMMLEDRYKDT